MPDVELCYTCKKTPSMCDCTPPGPTIAIAISTRPMDWNQAVREKLFTEAQIAKDQERVNRLRR